MKNQPKQIQSISELKTLRKELNSDVMKTIGFVPTMGALHLGHAALLRKLRERCDYLFLSIFVNPAQFGPKEDFAKYPRNLESDLKVAQMEGVDFVFTPNAQEMYGQNYSTYVEENLYSQPLCGKSRPGHFKGVTTVVLKLLNLIQPHLTYFGIKDAQQFFVIKKMVEDLNLDTVVEAVRTVREPDGLALSSRNAYLSSDERKRAPLIYASLQATALAFEKGISEDPLETAKELLFKEGFDVEYFELRSLPGFQLQTWNEFEPHKPAVLATAVRTESGTRLIDNVILNEPKLKEIGVNLN